MNNLEERNKLISMYCDLYDKYSEQIKKIDAGEEVDNFNDMSSKIFEITERYKKVVPIKGLSRCPFSGERVSHSLDFYGLDGLWWNSDSPIRPKENLPRTCFGFTGALMLGNKIEEFPFICSPGPDVPFVLPRLLSYLQVKAVISSFTVGVHRAYFIFYFSDPVLTGIERPNEFGTNGYRYTDLNGEIRYGQYYDSVKDFDLKPWIENGKLLWIHPDDDTLMLHAYVSGCPYLKLTGNIEDKYISNGNVWTSNEDSENSDLGDEALVADYPIDEDSINKALKFMEEGGEIL